MKIFRAFFWLSHILLISTFNFHVFGCYRFFLTIIEVIMIAVTLIIATVMTATK